MMKAKIVGVLLLACALSACGGGGGNGDDSGATSNQLPGGIYSGSLIPASSSSSSSPYPYLIGIVTESGHAKFVRVDNTAAPLPATAQGAVYAVSNIAPVGTSFTSTYTAYGQNGLTFPNGTTTETGTINKASIVSHYLIFGPYASSDTTPDTGTVSLGYSMVDYEQPAPSIAGTYGFTYIDANNATQTASISVDKSGNITSQADTAGCTYTGTLQAPDTTYNAYEGSIDKTCNGSSVTYDTVGFYIPANSTNTISSGTIGLDGYLVGTTGSNPAELYLVGTSDTPAPGQALVIPAKLTQN